MVCSVVAKSGDRVESRLLKHLVLNSEKRRVAMEISLCVIANQSSEHFFESKEIVNQLLESSEKEPDVYVKLLGALGSDAVWSQIGSMASINTAVALLVSDRTSSESALKAVSV